MRNIHQIIYETGLSYEELERATGIDKATFRNWDSAARKCSPEMVAMIEDELIAKGYFSDREANCWCQECGNMDKREVLFINGEKPQCRNNYCKKCDHYAVMPVKFIGVDIGKFTKYETIQEGA